jgi:hypothetical protein
MTFDLLDRTDTTQTPESDIGFGNALQKIFKQNQSPTQGFLQAPQKNSFINSQPFGGNSDEFKLPSFTPLDNSDIDPIKTMEFRPFKPDSDGFNFLFDQSSQNQQPFAPIQTMEDRFPNTPSTEPINKAFDGFIKNPNENLSFGQTPQTLLDTTGRLDKDLLNNPLESGLLKNLSFAPNKDIENPLANFFEQRAPFDPDQPPNITVAGRRGGGKGRGKKGKGKSQEKNQGETSNNETSSIFEDIIKPKGQLMDELLEKTDSEFTGNIFEDLWHIFTSSDDETSETETLDVETPEKESSENTSSQITQSPRPLDPDSKDFYKNNTQEEVTRDLDQTVNALAKSRGIEPGTKEHLELRIQKLIEWEKDDKHPKYTNVKNPHHKPEENPLDFGQLPKKVMTQIEAKYGKDYRFNFGTVRLPIGNVWKDENGNVKGMGKLKIDSKRSSGNGNKSTNQLQDLGFNSTEDYVDYVGKNYDEIYFNSTTKRLMLIKREKIGKRVNTLSIELSPTDGKAYNVITAIPLKTNNFNNNSGPVGSEKRFEKLWP